MRRTILLTMLALAACSGENTGWNPNYRSTQTAAPKLAASSAYQRYRVTREAALTGRVGTPDTVPMARPFKAPTAAQIAGRSPVQVVRGTRPVAAVAVAPVATVAVAPVAASATAPATAPSAMRPQDSAALSRYALALQPGARFSRVGASAAASARACRSFPTADAAQAAFLAAGGPQQDPHFLDHDGDGIVCGWSQAAWKRGAGL